MGIESSCRSDSTGSTTDYPYTLMVPQNVTEQVLLDRLEELGGSVRTSKTDQEDGSDGTRTRDLRRDRPAF